MGNTYSYLQKSKIYTTKTRLLWGKKTLQNLSSKFLARHMKTFPFIATIHMYVSRSNHNQRLKRSNAQAPPSFVISDMRPRTEPEVEYNRNTFLVFWQKNSFRDLARMRLRDLRSPRLKTSSRADRATSRLCVSIFMSFTFENPASFSRLAGFAGYY